MSTDISPAEATASTGSGEGNDGAEESVEAIIVNLKVELETAFRLYYMRHGFEAYDPTMAQFHALLGFMVIKTLSKTGGQGHGTERSPGSPINTGTRLAGAGKVVELLTLGASHIPTAPQLAG